MSAATTILGRAGSLLPVIVLNVIALSCTITITTAPPPSPVDSLPKVSSQPVARPTPLPRGTSGTPVPAPTARAPSPANRPPDRIVAPSIKLDARVVEMGWRTVRRGQGEVTEWIVPSFAAGFAIGSALPGQVGNTVLSGHHNIEGKVFEHLIHLSPGDPVSLYVGDTLYSYTVDEKFLLREEGVSAEQRLQNAQWIAPTTDERLTLVTCWPPTGNTYRLIVIARPAA